MPSAPIDRPRNIVPSARTSNALSELGISRRKAGVAACRSRFIEARIIRESACAERVFQLRDRFVQAARIPAVALRARVGEPRLDNVARTAADRPDFRRLDEPALEGRDLLVHLGERERVLADLFLALAGDEGGDAELAAFGGRQL